MQRFLAFVLAGLAVVPASAVTKLDVTVTSGSGNAFSAPIFTFRNQSTGGTQITKLTLTGGAPFDFVFAPEFAAPYGLVLPPGGTRTLLIGEERSSDGNNGCTASISYGLTGFDPGESFSFAVDPETPSCGSAVVDFRPFLAADIPSIDVSFANGETLSGHDWTFELINPAGNPAADTNQLYRLTLSGVEAVPEPASWAMMILGFGGVGYAMRRNRKVGVSFS